MDLEKMERQGQEILKKLLSKYAGEGMKLLEIGCGNDFFMKRIEREFGVKAKCVDPYGYGEKVLRMGAEKIALLGENFDIIYSLQSLHHLAGVEKFLEDAVEIMVKEGKLLLVDWKRGVNTGIQERYFSLEEMENMVKKYFRILERGKREFHFYIVATPIH